MRPHRPAQPPQAAHGMSRKPRRRTDVRRRGECAAGVDGAGVEQAGLDQAASREWSLPLAARW
ncbi:hypothetical protein ACFOPN_17710 [Xanthomonas hyacinthi]|uniref:hypothetical protein n=1 Tax=Xanthomonas hyacinthi TaxID=56455 RepID=UPI00361DABB9